MRRVLVLLAAVMLTLGVSFSASARPLNIEGTITTEISSDLPGLNNTLGGVATVNGSAGPIPAHLQTLQIKGSRGGGQTSAMVAITDPLLAGSNGEDQFAVQYTFDVTAKPTGERIQGTEMALYQVKDGKIVREQFFYHMPGA